jgi:hypothetical protein
VLLASIDRSDKHVWLVTTPPPPKKNLRQHTTSTLTFSVLLASIDRSDKHTLLIVKAGDQPPF